MAFLLVSCTQNKPAPLNEVDLLINNEDQLTQVIIYDVFSPPVASRIYVYSSLASYEAIRFAKEGSSSIAEKLNGFGKMPVPEKGKNYNFSLAATKAFFKVARNVKVFSIDSLTKYEESVYNNYKANLEEVTYKNSIAFGDTVAGAILARAKKDGYAISRGKQKYLGSNEPGKWRPTPPDYLDGVEWCWNTMKPMVLDSASQFMPNRPPKYETKPGTTFYAMMKEVYDINKNLTAEQKLIAKYWDDNPFVIEHAGHMVYGNKKITPGGHWIGITAQVVKQANADAVKSAQSFALTAVALFDGFISCWDEKYRSSYVRPVSVINELLDKNWAPLLQTPPFPEYTSGHSTVSSTAAEILTSVFGDGFAFTDSSELEYNLPVRSFKSFREAASEASISRVYGGIHYRSGCEGGNKQGKKLGEIILKKLEE
jgi:hypothetical protein